MASKARRLCPAPPDLETLGGIHHTRLDGILEKRPDLVLLPQGQERFQTGLRYAGIDGRFFTTKNFATIQNTFHDLGQALGREAEARELVQGLRRSLLELREGVLRGVKCHFYH